MIYLPNKYAMPRPFYKIPKSKIDEIIRVDHAGEFGAQRIYLGQIKYSSDSKDKQQIQHMLEQEQKHLDYFTKSIQDYKVRPTALMPFWNVAGYAIGAISAKAGPKTAMMVTEAVEDVIEKHYLEQIETLENSDLHPDLELKDQLENHGQGKVIDKEELLSTIKQFRQEEIEHKHIAIESDSQLAPMSHILPNIVKRFCKLSIALSKKI